MQQDIVNLHTGTYEHSPAVGVFKKCTDESQKWWVEREMQKQGFCMRRDAQGRFYSALSQSTYTDRLNGLRGRGRGDSCSH